MLLDNRHAFWIFSLWHTMFCSNGLGIQRLWDQICWNWNVCNYSIIYHLFTCMLVWALNGVNPKNSPPPAILNPPVSSVFAPGSQRVRSPRIRWKRVRTSVYASMPWSEMNDWSTWRIGPHDLDTCFFYPMMIPLRPRKKGAKMVVLNVIIV